MNVPEIKIFTGAEMEQIECFMFIVHLFNIRYSTFHEYCTFFIVKDWVVLWGSIVFSFLGYQFQRWSDFICYNFEINIFYHIKPKIFCWQRIAKNWREHLGCILVITHPIQKVQVLFWSRLTGNWWWKTVVGLGTCGDCSE